MLVFLCTIAFFAFIFCGVMTIVLLFKKNGKTKKFGIGIILSFVLFLVFAIISPTPTKNNQVATNNTTKVEEKVISNKQDTVKKDTQAKVEKVASKPTTKTTKKSIVSTNTKELPSKTIGNLKIHYINVGQADSILIQQNGHNMLIDAGNNADSNLVVNYLKQQGMSKLDYVIGTHPHEDHIGGLDAVINTFNIGQVFMPKKTSTTKTYKDVILAIKNKGLKITTPIPLFSYNLGGARWTILAPSKNKDYEDVNNYSIVCRLRYGNTSFMFDGDAEALSEMEMIRRNNLTQIDVLKVGHHGSNSSTCANFLNKVNPKYAVISCGINNKYGHPHKGTMDRFKSKNIKVYRTDECGTIICTSDGKSIKFNKKQGSYKYIGNSATKSTKSLIKAPSKKSTAKKADKVQPKTKTNSDNSMVYIVGNGKKYHRAGCRYLHGNGKAIPLKDAKVNGYTSCKRCNPPQ